MKYKILLISFLIWFSFQAVGQDRTSTEPRMDLESSPKEENDVEKAPISLYKIISVENDTTFADTTLTIQKYYRFNYLRKDNFGLLPFSNVGRAYNKLTYDFIEEQHVFPEFGARARHFNFMEVEDVFYYHVPTPFTELFYKTVFEQGQILDALFTVNTSENLNLSIAYKGMRSLGRYQHMLTSTGNFRTTISYSSPNKKYRLRTHFVSQDLLNEENGGLSPSSLEQYIAENPEFNDRARLDVNFENAQSTLFGKRFFLDHSLNLFRSGDTLATANLSIGHKLNHTYKKFQFQQTNAEEFFGPSFEQTGLRDETRLSSTYNELYISLATGRFGRITGRAGVNHYDYGYNTVLSLEEGFIENRLQGDIVSAGGSYSSVFGPLRLDADATVNVLGHFPGYNVAGKFSMVVTPDILLAATANINDRAPNFNFLLYQSDYINYNWQRTFSNESRQSVGLQLRARKLVNLDAEISTINDRTFFALNDDGLTRPFQHEEQVSYVKVQGQKEFGLGKFALNNTVLLQRVLDGEDVLNVPDLVTRNTLYYSDHWFQRALFLQTGFNFNYFTSYEMDGYDPVLAEFYVQNELEFEGFPTVDFFFNGKIRQARIFFELEHVNALVQGNNHFSAPLYPYRDFGIRFGLVWNFFM